MHGALDEVEAAWEIPHAPVDEPSWGEAYTFRGCAPDGGVAFFHHLGRVAGDPALWRGVFATCLPGGEVLAMKDHGRAESGWGPGSSGLSFTCEEPLRRWTVAYDGVARQTSAAALAAGALSDGRTVPVRMELSFETPERPWSFDLGTGLHYEQCGRFGGWLEHGGRTVEVEGAGWRDHTVGRPLRAPFLAHTWLSGQFPSGRSFHAFSGSTAPDRGVSAACVSVGGRREAALVKEAPVWAGPEGDPGNFALLLETEQGPVEVEGRTLGPRLHWSAAEQAEVAPGGRMLGEIVLGAGSWPTLAATVAVRWDGEDGCGLLEVSRRRA